MLYDFSIASTDLHQSDVFNTLHFACDDQYRPAVLLTPECDLVIQPGRTKPKASFLLFAGIVPFDDLLNNILSQLRITKKQRVGEEAIDASIFEDLKTSLRRFFNGAIFPRFFYLPPITPYFEDSVIDYQLLETRKATTELLAQLHEMRLASIRSSWKEAIPSRFTDYSGRIGVIDLSEHFIDSIFQRYQFEFFLVNTEPST